MLYIPVYSEPSAKYVANGPKLPNILIFFLLALDKAFFATETDFLKMFQFLKYYNLLLLIFLHLVDKKK